MAKPPKCKICKNEFTRQRPFQVCCSYEHAIIFAKENQAKKAKKDWVKEKAERKEKLKTLSDYEAEAKKVFQAWVRKRDALLPQLIQGNKASLFLTHA